VSGDVCRSAEGSNATRMEGLLSDRGGWFRWQEATFNAKTPQMTSAFVTVLHHLAQPDEDNIPFATLWFST
jgi:hypothetical protein